MPRSQTIDPSVVRAAGSVSFADIPINAYNPDSKTEIAKHGVERLRRVYHDMATIREFETMLNEIKTQGVYRDIEYNHKGPAHLSIGQESAVVGQCLHLGIEDYIFGSHRSHGEILAKCYSAIWQLSDSDLESVMKDYFDGEILRLVDDGSAGSVKELAEDFVLYGTLAEIFGRRAGFNRGLGGSMHAFFAPFGS
ncbi:MAG: dehydrogenase, partial [Spirochaetaceae bacterium]